MKLTNTFIDKMERLLNIMSDATRLRIMLALFKNDSCTCECGAMHCSNCECLSCVEEKSVNELVNELGISQSLVSHQLAVLRKYNIVKNRRDGHKIFYSLTDGHIKELINITIEHLEEK